MDTFSKIDTRYWWVPGSLIGLGFSVLMIGIDLIGRI
jgi:hypothetical protein